MEKAFMFEIPGVITVRTSSSRLPEKCLLPFGDFNVLTHIIRRALFFDIVPIVCTSVDSTDDVIEEIARKEGVKCYRGSLINKLKRWSDCATTFNLQSFHTIDADDPFFDGDEIKASMKLLNEGNYDMVYPTKSSSEGGATVGYSLTSDIVTRALKNIPEDADTEMMWYYIEKLKGLKAVVVPETESLPFKVRLTLDYEEDYWLLESIRRILGNFVTRNEIKDFFMRNPDFYKVNWFRNEAWKEGQEQKRI
jgi:spore coat polysaccharide biosynthesis protein SpsF